MSKLSGDINQEMISGRETIESLRQQLSAAASEILALRKANKECVEYFNECQKDLAEKDAEIARLNLEHETAYKLVDYWQKKCAASQAGKDAEIERLTSDFDIQQSQLGEMLEKLAASQTRERQLREALKAAAGKFHNYAEYHSMKERTRDNIEKIERNMALARMCDEALDTPTDTSALEAMIQKAGEVMRERCLSEIDPKYYTHGLLKEVVEGCCGDLRSLPNVTLEDLR